MEIFTNKKEALDPDAKKLLECADNLDISHEVVRRHLKDLASLVGEMKDGGFEIHIVNKKFNEKDLTPGYIRIMLSKGRETQTIYHQVFGIFFLQDFKDLYPDKESLRKMVAESKIKLEEKLKGQHRPSFNFSE